jgi:hypothetical protein
MEHPLCRHTVTLYRAQGRQVVEGCFCTWKDLPKASILGDGSRREFFLVLPGHFGGIAPGDWVCEGVGPESGNPSAMEGAQQVRWAKPMRDPGIFGSPGRLMHTEAGNN